MGNIPEIHIETEDTPSEFEKNQVKAVEQAIEFLSAKGGGYFAEETGFCPQDLWTQDIDPAA
ncbi:MAG: hypothetical protein Q8P40_00340 [Nitrospirota bacterium]|nr:hypothetical protein [Nitrospirota bacterium]